MDQIVLETMESYNNYVGQIIKGSNKIADDLRTGNVENALSMIKDFSEGLVWIIEVNQKLKEFGKDINLNISEIQEFFVEINEGLENKDFVLVADLFEYEIAPFFEQLELYK